MKKYMTLEFSISSARSDRPPEDPAVSLRAHAAEGWRVVCCVSYETTRGNWHVMYTLEMDE